MLIGLIVLAFLVPPCPHAHAAPADFPYYELRIYDVTTNKLDAVLQRFRDTVDPVRHKHGITTLGYWSAATPEGAKFIYLLAAPGPDQLKQQETQFGADEQFRAGFAASTQKHGKTVDKITSIPLKPADGASFDFASGSATATATTTAATPAAAPATVTAPAPGPAPRAFVLRIYSILPGKLDVFRERWTRSAVPLYEKHGLHNIGSWVAETPDAAGNPRFVCLLAGPNAATIATAVHAFHQDPDWQKIEKQTELTGKLRSAVLSYDLTPADFSQLK